jgi:hypothetical protein
VLLVCFAALALAGGAAHRSLGAPRAATPPLPLPCGLPQTQPLWVDYADGMVPFWSTIFARPGIVGAASNFIVPPQLRAKGASTVYFDLYLNNRVGTPSKPADPATIQGRADKLFDTAVSSSGCAQPLMALNELFGAQLPTPWTPTTAQYRANVLAFVQELAAKGARPLLLLSNRPYTHDDAADEWWRQVAQYADLVPEVYFSGPSVYRQGAVAGGRRLRATLRTRIEDLIQIGVPPARIGVMLTFSSTPHAGGREGLQPLRSWLDVVKWEALAAKQVASELKIASVWSWGWAAFNVAGNDPDKPKAACVWLWTRDHSLCDAPTLAGADFDPSLDVGATLSAGTLCLVGSGGRIDATAVAAVSRLTGDRDVAFSAELAHAVLAQAERVSPAAAAAAVQGIVLDRFGGSRGAYLAALAKAHASRVLASTIVADELRRKQVEAGLRVPAPTSREIGDWYATHATASARSVRVDHPVPWLAGRSGIALASDAPGRLFAAPAGAKIRVGDVKVTVLGETAPLAAFPLLAAEPAVRAALLGESRDAAFDLWSSRRQNQALAQIQCAHDQPPQPSTVDLTDWLPFLALS